MVLGAQAPIDERPLRAQTRPLPEPGPEEVVVAVAACGVCRTDLHIVEGDLPLRRVPIVPGHQIVGRVLRVGSAVTRFAAGARVGVAWLGRTCGECEPCRSGRENLCERAVFTGYDVDGGFAEYAVAPAAFAYAMPKQLGDAEAAPLLCAGIIGYRALKLANLARGGRLGVYGFGSSAHLVLQLAAKRGHETFVCTREPTHRALARSLGAAWTGDIADPFPAPAHGIIVFAPAGALVPRALRNLAPGGSVVLAGIYMTPIPELDYAAVYGERVIRSVTANTRADGDELLAEAAAGGLRPRITTFPLEAANEALLALKRGGFVGSGVLVV